MTQSPLLHGVTTLAYALHIGGGTIGLFAGTVAAFARKGGRLHRRAGTVFTISMLIMAVFAVYLAIAIPGQNLILSAGSGHSPLLRVLRSFTGLPRPAAEVRPRKPA